MKKLISVILCVALIFGAYSFSCFAAGDYKPYENSEYFTYGDYEIHYRVFPAKGERLGRIMLLHGFVCSTFSWRNMAEKLTAGGWECVAVDLPDFGYSTRETPDMKIIPREDIIIALMEHLGGDEKWVLAGHSMGGGVAVNIAEKVDLKALLLYCPCPQDEFPAAAEKIVKSAPMKAFMNAFFKYGTRLTPLVRLIIWAATNNPKFALEYDTAGVTAPVQYDGFGAGMCEMMYNVLPTDLENAGKITCPVLLCQAQKDIILNSSQKSRMNDAFPEAEKHTLSGAGHQMIEDRADELSELTLGFLNFS